MLKFWLLRLHRWLALLFALPLTIVLLTGLILSFEPIVQTSGQRAATLAAPDIDRLLTAHDPKGEARGLSFRPYENRLTIQSSRGGGSTDIDLASGQIAEAKGTLSALFGLSRGLHERLLFDLGELVTASTIAMLALILFGVAMGWPRLRNTLSGWHKGIAWFGLPLLVASPLTGLFLAFGISFTGSDSGAGRQAAPLPMREAVQIVARDKDLSQLVWLRSRGGRQLVRLNEGGVFNVYAVTSQGLRETPKNWPRLFHEGNFAGIWSGLMNVAISLALLALLGTGLVIWAKRKLRPRNRDRAARRGAAAPAAA